MNSFTILLLPVKMDRICYIVTVILDFPELLRGSEGIIFVQLNVKTYIVKKYFEMIIT